MTAYPSMRDRTVLVTGATNGIGRAAATALAGLGAAVVLVGRDRPRAESAVAAIAERTGNAQVSYLLGDLSSMGQVRGVAGQFLQGHDRLDVLVNNAGAVFARRRLTNEGFEMTLALNVLSPFLLTDLLLDVLRHSAPSRIVNVSSSAHRLGRLDVADLQSERAGMGPGGMGAYGRSKLMLLLLTSELALRLTGTGVTANAMHPGVVATRFGYNNGRLAALLLRLARPFARSSERGAETIVYLAASPDVAGVTGRYFVDRRPVASSDASHDEALRKDLWAATAGLLAPTAPEPSPFL
jgi:NAD(P)-dependent dehydrogenase (short-subunit alcohol dehydrogenase family)